MGRIPDPIRLYPTLQTHAIFLFVKRNVRGGVSTVSSFFLGLHKDRAHFGADHFRDAPGEFYYQRTHRRLALVFIH
jgi:hypothetical protein